MISIFDKYSYNEVAMKNLKKLALLFGVGLMSLTACANEKRFYYLETSDSSEYQEGECYQVSKNDVIDAIYLISVPSGEVDKNGEPISDIVWNREFRLSYFYLTDGLKGKSIISIKRHTDYALKINIDCAVNDVTSTFGYVKVSHYAFTTKSQRAKGVSSLYAYVAIGSESGRTNKPAEQLQ